jgi:hypothetical protein
MERFKELDEIKSPEPEVSNSLAFRFPNLSDNH